MHRKMSLTLEHLDGKYFSLLLLVTPVLPAVLPHNHLNKRLVDVLGIRFRSVRHLGQKAISNGSTGVQIKSEEIIKVTTIFYKNNESSEQY